MLFRAAPVVVLTALLAQSVLATNCPPGKYRVNTPGVAPGYKCVTCPQGQYKQGTNSWTSCSKCPAGKTNKPDNTGCDTCPGQKWSIEGGACVYCPAGQEVRNDHKGCDKCEKGEYNPTPGGRCAKCPSGEFTSVEGSTDCCKCCAGWYADGRGNKECKQCKNGEKYSAVGSNSCDDCKKYQNGLPNYTNSCDMSGKTCPPTTPGGPVGSPVASKKRNTLCPSGFTSCPRLTGTGGSDCVDTESDAESCGGCVGADGEGAGTDCTAAEGVSATRCVKGSCVVDSCRKGFTKSIDGTSCVLSGSDELHAQGSHSNKRSSAKRAVRHTMF
ncbi:Dihydroxyacetone synthase [Tulasnella sp. 408]|nr:Dihydroxyacetone synthase [Tulasnella sp. 408]